MIGYRFKKENFLKLKSKRTFKFKKNILDKQVFQNSIDKNKHLVFQKLPIKQTAKLEFYQ